VINSSVQMVPLCLSAEFAFQANVALYYVLFHFVAKALKKLFSKI